MRNIVIYKGNYQVAEIMYIISILFLIWEIEWLYKCYKYLQYTLEVKNVANEINISQAFRKCH